MELEAVCSNCCGSQDSGAGMKVGKDAVYISVPRAWIIKTELREENRARKVRKRKGESQRKNFLE
jgi:hypothetical protein